MQINSGYGNTTTNWNQTSKVQKHKNTNTSNTFALNENKHSFGNVNLEWGEGAVLACATPGGNSFTLYKNESYSREDPWLLVKGVDQQGNSYEERINAKGVDPSNSSYVELMALNAYLVDIGTLKSSMDYFPRENTDDFAKQNYMSILQDWRDMQQKMGNWAGYKQFSDVCNALSGFTK
ncbi:MAG: hypothetical protein NC305_18885 [Lachnospiraceae bacterium]|nr:hypothetical protein [Lachnospiraceae bacterium]